MPIFAQVYRENDEWMKERKGLLDLSFPKYPSTGMHKISLDLGASGYSELPHASYLRGEAIDLTAWQKFYRALPEAHLSGAPGTPAQDVLTALHQMDPEMHEIETALDNPHAGGRAPRKP